MRVCVLLYCSMCACVLLLLQGVIPLGNCNFEDCVDGVQKFAIRIRHDHFKGEIVVGAESEDDCKKWTRAFKECAKV